MNMAIIKLWHAFTLVIVIIAFSCVPGNEGDEVQKLKSYPADVPDTIKQDDRMAHIDTILPPVKDVITENKQTLEINTISPQAVVSFAETLVGVPYKYGSIDPHYGFDCSGFITYVFRHFGIEVPRSSVDFTNVGKEISTSQAKPGDLILFTGTDANKRVVGHMGIVRSNNKDSLEFIHSSSGKAYGVVITPLNEHYDKRYMKTIRVLKKNDESK